MLFFGAQHGIRRLMITHHSRSGSNQANRILYPTQQNTIEITTTSISHDSFC